GIGRDERGRLAFRHAHRALGLAGQVRVDEPLDEVAERQRRILRIHAQGSSTTFVATRRSNRSYPSAAAAMGSRCVSNGVGSSAPVTTRSIVAPHNACTGVSPANTSEIPRIHATPSCSSTRWLEYTPMITTRPP